MSNNSFNTPIPDTPECVSSHCGVYACRADEIKTMHALILSGTVAAKSAAQLDAEKSAPAEYDVTPDGVAVIPVRGVMQRSESKFGGVVSTVRVRRMMRDARNREDVRGVMLAIDSPGGAVAGQTELIDELERLAAEKPVWSAVDEMACSAAYWLASKTGHIVANRLACVANIGCYCVAYDETQKLAREGIRLVLVSTGKYKGMGADGAVPEELVSELQKDVDAINAAFCADVSAGRGMDPARVSELADGRWYSGAEAVSLGFIDSIANFEEAMTEFSAYLKNQQEEKEMEDNKKVEEFQALADSDGYEFAKANFNKSPEQIELARKDAKIAALEASIAELTAENAKLTASAAEAETRAEAAEKAKAEAEEKAKPKALGADPVPVQPVPRDVKGKAVMFGNKKEGK